MCLPHVSSIFKKNQSQNFWTALCISLLNGFNKNIVYSANGMIADTGETKYFSFLP